MEATPSGETSGKPTWPFSRSGVAKPVGSVTSAPAEAGDNAPDRRAVGRSLDELVSVLPDGLVWRDLHPPGLDACELRSGVDHDRGDTEERERFCRAGLGRV